MSNENESGTGCLSLLAIIAVVVFGYFAWPFSLLVIVSVFVVVKTSEPSNILVAAVNRIATPILWGLGAFSFLYLILNLFDFFSPSSVAGLEEMIVGWRLKTKSLINVSFWKLAGVLVFLLVATFVFPAFKWVTKFSKVYSFLYRLTVMLAVMSAFTFFAQKPADNLIEIDHIRRVNSYEILLREGQESVGRYMAAELISREIKELTQKQKLLISIKIDSIETVNRQVSRALGRNSSNNSFRYKDGRISVAEDLANTLVSKLRVVSDQVKLEPDEKAVEERSLFEETLTLKDKLKQITAIKEREVFNSRAKQTASEAVKALDLLAVKSFGLESSGSKEIGEAFIKKVASLYAQRMTDTHFVKKLNLEKKIEGIVQQVYEMKPFDNLFYEKPGGSGNGGSFAKASKIDAVIVRSSFETMLAQQVSAHNIAVSNQLRAASNFGSGKSSRSYGG